MPAEGVLRLFGRLYCHLCTDLKAELEARIAGLPVVLEWVDLDLYEEWEPLYGEEIPVLLGDGVEICRHRLDPMALDAFLSRFS